MPLYDFSPLQADRTIAPRDGMVAPEDPEQYFTLGRRALELIHFSSVLCNKPHYPAILDLPCGHGRVLRWLRAHYHYAKITACDLDHDGVDFCAKQFGATPVYSQRDLKQLRSPPSSISSGSARSSRICAGIVGWPRSTASFNGRMNAA